MSIQLSRRDFMKCSAVAVLAAASGTLLTGCSGGGSGITYEAGVPASANGITVTLMRRSESDSPAFGSNVGYDNILGIGDHQLLDLTFEVKNTTDKPIRIVEDPHIRLGKLIEAIGNCVESEDLAPLKAHLQTAGTFMVQADGKQIPYLFYFEKDIDNLFNPADLAPNGDVKVHLLCVAPLNWKKININYKKLGLNFVQSRN